MTAEICKEPVLAPASLVYATDTTHLFQIHLFHRLVHSLNHIRHTACHLSHGNCRLYFRADRIDARSKSEEVQLLVLFANRILGVDFGDIRVTLLDCLFPFDQIVAILKQFVCLTLFSFAFSVVSSLPAFAACLFSCFAVNCDGLVSECALAACGAVYLQVEKCLFEAGHGAYRFM